MSRGEGPIGAAKGKQPNSEALCHPPPPQEIEEIFLDGLLAPFLLLVTGIPVWFTRPPNNALQCQPPPRSGEQNPMFWRNVPASRFFSKRGSRCPGSQSQGANTPSFWLFGSWSNVETQSIPQFAKKQFSSLGLYMVPGQQYFRTCHWSSGYALVCRSASVGAIPCNGPPNLFALFVTWL